MRRFFRSIWNWFYEKIKGVILGYVYGGGLALFITSALNQADVSSLTPAQQTAVTFASMMILGLLNGIRRPETADRNSPTPPRGL